MSTPKYDGYHKARKFVVIELRLQELRDAGFDCEISRSEVVQHKEIRAISCKAQQHLNDFHVCFSLP